MELEYRLLSSTDVSDALEGLKGWEVEEGMLIQTFVFDAYQKGLVFACAVGYLADAMNHHPDLSIGYQKVKVSLSTHDVGGLSPYDIALAHKIDKSLN